MSKVYVVTELIYDIPEEVYDTGVGGTVGVFDSVEKAIEYIYNWYDTECMVDHHVGDCRGWYIFKNATHRVVLSIKRWEVNKGIMDELAEVW